MRGAKPALVAANDAHARPPSAPSWLPPEAKGEWRRVARVLVERRVLTVADLATLENYCLAVGQVKQAQVELSAAPSLFVSSEKSAPRPHPAIRLMHSAMAEARRQAAELGLTPMARNRSGLKVDDHDDGGWDGLVDG